LKEKEKEKEKEKGKEKGKEKDCPEDKDHLKIFILCAVMLLCITGICCLILMVSIKLQHKLFKSKNMSWTTCHVRSEQQLQLVTDRSVEYCGSF